MLGSRGIWMGYLLRAVGGTVFQILTDEVDCWPLFIVPGELRKGKYCL